MTFSFSSQTPSLRPSVASLPRLPYNISPQINTMPSRNSHPNPVSLCWNCIHASNPKPHICPWSAHGKKVEGWKIKKGSLSIQGTPTPIVMSCPLYSKKYQFFELSEITEALCSYYNRPYYSLVANPYNLRLLSKRYEKATNTTLPEWYYLSLEAREEKRKAALRGESVSSDYDLEDED